MNKLDIWEFLYFGTDVDVSHNQLAIWIHNIWIRKKSIWHALFSNYEAVSLFNWQLRFLFVSLHAYLPCHKTICAVNMVNNWNKRLFRANHDIINNGGPNYIALLQHKVLNLLFFLVRKKIRWKLLVSISGVPNNSYSAIGGS